MCSILMLRSKITCIHRRCNTKSKQTVHNGKKVLDVAQTIVLLIMLMVATATETTLTYMYVATSFGMDYQMIHPSPQSPLHTGTIIEPLLRPASPNKKSLYRPQLHLGYLNFQI